MHDRYGASFRLVTLIFVLIGSLLVGLQVSLAQDVGSPESTPSASPSPKFFIAAVGDYPEGYFRDVEAAPGSSLQLTVSVVNFGDVPAELSIDKVNALSGINGGFIAGDEADAPIGSTAWIDFPSQTLTLQPGAEQPITFTVSVPADAQPGQYISGLVAKTAGTLPIPGATNLDHTLAYAISIGILVPGDITHSFELGSPAIEMQGVIRSLRVPITNTGTYLVRPTGELTLSDTEGEVVHTSQITMSSVYSGLTTAIEVVLPEQMATGKYTVDLSLTDPDSNARGEIADEPVTLPEPKDPAGLYVEAATITPNADPIAFANVAVTLNNGGQQLPASDVTLTVMRDGKEVEQFPLATNQVLPNGTTELTARYIPEKAWESGTYTFTITVSAVDPNGGTETVLTTYEVEDTIVVP